MMAPEDSEIDALIQAAKLRQAEYFESEDDDFREPELSALLKLTWGGLDSPPDPVAAGKVLDRGIAMLASDDPDDRILGIRLIRETHLQERRAGGAILDVFKREQDPDVIWWCVGGLYFKGFADAIPNLLALLEHPNPRLRYTLAGAISSCSADRLQHECADDDGPATMPENALVALLQLASDKDDEVRFSALFELATWWEHEGLRDYRVGAALRDGLTDEDEGIRYTCAEALVHSGPDDPESESYPKGRP